MKHVTAERKRSRKELQTKRPLRLFDETKTNDDGPNIAFAGVQSLGKADLKDYENAQMLLSNNY